MLLEFPLPVRLAVPPFSPPLASCFPCERHSSSPYFTNFQDLAEGLFRYGRMTPALGKMNVDRSNLHVRWLSYRTGVLKLEKMPNNATTIHLWQILENGDLFNTHQSATNPSPGHCIHYPRLGLKSHWKLITTNQSPG